MDLPGDKITVRLTHEADNVHCSLYWASVPFGDLERAGIGVERLAREGFDSGGIGEHDVVGYSNSISAAEALSLLEARLEWHGFAGTVELARGSLRVLSDSPSIPEGPPGSLSGCVSGLAYLAAREGALLLDRLDPGWEDSVEPRLIYQDDENFDVLAQRMGSRDAGERFLMERLSDPDAEPGQPGHRARVMDYLEGCGFSSEDLFVDKDQRRLAADYLNAYWRRETAARKEGLAREEPPVRTEELLYVASVRLAVRVPWGRHHIPAEDRAEELLDAVLGAEAVVAWRYEPTRRAHLILTRPEEAVGGNASGKDRFEDLPF